MGRRSDAARLVAAAVAPSVDTLMAGFRSAGFPVDVEGIAKSLGIHVAEMERIGSVLGALNLTSVGWVMALAPQPEHTRRWTMAHELGHYLLHGGRSHPVFSRRGKGLSWVEEVEANVFGACLLLPREACEKALVGHLEPEWPRVLVETFGVSLSAAKWRLVELSLADADTPLASSL